MRAEDLQAALRPRTMWEAIDLGVALTRRQIGVVAAWWLLVVTPLCAAVCAVHAVKGSAMLEPEMTRDVDPAWFQPAANQNEYTQGFFKGRDHERKRIICLKVFDRLTNEQCRRLLPQRKGFAFTSAHGGRSSSYFNALLGRHIKRRQ
jgi:hypothetical protein